MRAAPGFFARCAMKFVFLRMVFRILDGRVRASNQELETSLQEPGTSLWSRAMRLELGVLPVPVFLCAAVIVVLAAYTGRLTADLIGGLAVMMVAGTIGATRLIDNLPFTVGGDR